MYIHICLFICVVPALFSIYIYIYIYIYMIYIKLRGRPPCGNHRTNQINKHICKYIDKCVDIFLTNVNRFPRLF